MPTTLLNRLTPLQDETPATAVMTGHANWMAGWGGEMAEVRSLTVHVTAGWPRRDTSQMFVLRYIVPGTDDRGIGTQYYVSSDGTVLRLIDLPRSTWHAEFQSGYSLGVETGNGTNYAPVQPPSSQWVQATTATEDVAGLKLWVTSQSNLQPEVLPAWWTTASFPTSGWSRRDATAGARWMLFHESIYRSWAILARYLLERFRLPRNFPLLPHARRNEAPLAPTGLMEDSESFRRLVLADERAEMFLRMYAAAPHNIPESTFEPANAATLQQRYAGAVVRPQPVTQPDGTVVQPALKHHNPVWQAFFRTYRGVHGHAFAGSIRRVNPEHDCPGPLFDWHRMAREVWDWWWYPFDLPPTARMYRTYNSWSGTTPLFEYYWEEDETARLNRTGSAIHGPRSSPATFALEPQTRVYAMANGELVAARFPAPGAGVSMAFVLVRHQVYHLERVSQASQVAASLGFPSPHPNALDYDRHPSSVYSLYMHLGRPEGMSLDQVNQNNPEWLNRVLLRKKECDLGIGVYDRPNHAGIRDEQWNNRPPGTPQRPTTLEGWRADRAALGAFLDRLRAGQVAIAPPQDPQVQSIQIILGDFLGEAGVIRREAGVTTHGVRIETFSPTLVPPPFTLGFTTDWNPPRPRDVSLQYVSEWAQAVTDEAPFRAIGVDPAQLHWWHSVAAATQADPLLDVAAVIGPMYPVHHYHPFDFMRWINTVTWKHEWPKYDVQDAAGNPISIFDANGTMRRPRRRRV
jgi:hypothetical protein